MGLSPTCPSSKMPCIADDDEQSKRSGKTYKQVRSFVSLGRGRGGGGVPLRKARETRACWMCIIRRCLNEQPQQLETRTEDRGNRAPCMDGYTTCPLRQEDDGKLRISRAPTGLASHHRGTAAETKHYRTRPSLTPALPK